MRAVLLALLVLAVAATPAAARRGACGAAGGPGCHVWTGTAVSVNDGDTIDVDLAGDGRRQAYPVRFAAVQAMELTRHHPRHRSGECHAVAATNRVEALIRASGRRVRLAAQHPGSRAGGRLQRFVAVRREGRWQDLGSLLMREGLTLFMASDDEPALNRRYDQLGQEAALGGVGLWNPVACGAGPAAGTPIRIWANWDPPGIDSLDLNGEWMKVRNDSPAQPLPLGGWWVRDSMLRRFTFPSGTTLGPGETLTVFTGPGTGGRLAFHWGLDVTLFPNVGPLHLADGAYLFDPAGDLRAAMTYPCLVACADADQGAVQVSAEPFRREAAVVRNVSGRPVDLSDDVLAVHGAAFPFGAGTVLAPGASLRRSFRDDLGMTRPLLPDRGGALRVATFRDITLACDAWGSGRC